MTQYRYRNRYIHIPMMATQSNLITLTSYNPNTTTGGKILVNLSLVKYFKECYGETGEFKYTYVVYYNDNEQVCECIDEITKLIGNSNEDYK